MTEVPWPGWGEGPGQGAHSQGVRCDCLDSILRKVVANPPFLGHSSHGIGDSACNRDSSSTTHQNQGKAIASQGYVTFFTDVWGIPNRKLSPYVRASWKSIPLVEKHTLRRRNPGLT